MTMTITIIGQPLYILEYPDPDCRMTARMPAPQDLLPMHDRLDGSPCCYERIGLVIGWADA